MIVIQRNTSPWSIFTTFLPDSLQNIHAYSPIKRHGLIFFFPQDALLCLEAREVEQNRAQQRQAETRFLSRVARKQTPDRQEDPAEFLLNMARLRMCLSAAARLLETAALQGV